MRNFIVSEVGWRGANFFGTDHCSVENIFAFNIGDVSLNTSSSSIIHGIADQGGFDNYITHCTVYNSVYGGIYVFDAEATQVHNSNVFADDGQTGDLSGTDYYFALHDCIECIIESCFIERLAIGHSSTNDLHFGHGFCLLGYHNDQTTVCAGNTISKCLSKNLAEPFLLRGYGVVFNNIEDSTSVIDSELGSLSFGRIQLTNGPSSNKFNGMYLLNSDVAVSFSASESSSYQVAALHNSAAGNNTFYNSVFVCEIAISLWDYQDNLANYGSSPCFVTDNKFLNCNFISDPNHANGDRRGFFAWHRASEQNMIKNCIIENFDTYLAYLSDYNNPPLSTGNVQGWAITSSCFHILGPTSSFYNYYSGNGNVFGNPQISDSTNPTLASTFDLNGTLCRDAGEPIADVELLHDFDGQLRTDDFIDIGAREY